MLKKLILAAALAATAAPAIAQVSLNLNAPTTDALASNSGAPLNAATANAAYTVPLNGGQNDVGFTIAGLTASGAVLVLEGSNDGGQTWGTLNAAIGATGVLTSTFSADGMASANVAGRTTVRLRVLTPGTGNITITSNASVALGDVGIRKPLPPGANKIGGFTAADGDLATVGSKVDAPCTTSDATACSEVGLLKNLNGKATALAAVNGTPTDTAQIDPTQAGTQNAFLKGLVSLYAQLLATYTAPGTGAAKAGAVQGIANGVPLPATVAGVATATGQATNVAFIGATGAASALAASATFTGATRDSGAAAGTPQLYAYFNAIALADQTGTLFLDGSNDGTNWVATTTATFGAMAANTPLVLSTPVLFRYYRARVVNGATAQTTLTVNSGFTGG